MAEDQGKEKEKFDFTGEGEAVGYISLEQARVLAMQTARETPGEYGSQYQDICMAFEVVQAKCPAESPPYLSPAAVRKPVIIPGNSHAPTDRQIRNP